MQGSTLEASTPGVRGASSFKEGKIFYKGVSANSAYVTRRFRQRMAGVFGAEKVKELFKEGFDKYVFMPLPLILILQRTPCS